MINRPLLAVIPTLIAALMTAAPTRADQMFVHVQGTVQGVMGDWFNPVAELDGVSLADDGWVDDLSWSVISPRDAASGLPTGKRQYRALTLRVRMSAATLRLASALKDNENLPEVKVRWFARAPSASAYTLSRNLVLTNANVQSISAYTVHEDDDVFTYIDVAFTYQTIGIEDVEAAVSFVDDWESPTF